MAIYHCSVKTFSRRNGQSSTAAAAYRSGEKLLDENTGELHDYRRKGGVISATIILPSHAPAWASDRARLWNEAERAETRINSTVAREFEIALPHELSPNDRERLAHEFARELVEKHGFAADVAIHAPPEFQKGGTGKVIDNQNHHAHILLSTRRLGPNGFTEKTREFDARSNERDDDSYLFGPALIEHWRERFALLQNLYLARAGVAADRSCEQVYGVRRNDSVSAALGVDLPAGKRWEVVLTGVVLDHVVASILQAGKQVLEGGDDVLVDVAAVVDDQVRCPVLGEDAVQER